MDYAANRADAVPLAPLALGATVDYVIDWTEWLATDSGVDTDTISSATWTVPTGVTNAGSSILTGSKKTRIFLTTSDETLVDTYITVTCKITTAGGRILEPRSFKVKVVSLK